MATDDVTYANTPEWREAAARAFDEIGWGSKTRCANDVGCSSSLITKLLADEQDESSYLAAISDWLTAHSSVKVEHPPTRAISAAMQELIDIAGRIGEDAFRTLMGVARVFEKTERLEQEAAREKAARATVAPRKGETGEGGGDGGEKE